MKVMILCGGMGTRLREETEYRPKPMVEVGGRPVLWHIMKGYAHYGFKDFVLCLGYKGDMIKEYFLNYDAMNNDCTVSLGKLSLVEIHGTHEEQDFRVTLAETGEDTMTGARVKMASHYVDSDTFMVTYGDGLADVNIFDLLAFHKAHGKLATVTTMKPYSRFAVLKIDKDGTVLNFREKPQTNTWASAGFMVLNKEVLNYIGDDPSCVLEAEPMEKLSKERQLMAYRHDGFFFPMDTYRDYMVLNSMWKNGQTPWTVWKK